MRRVRRTPQPPGKADGVPGTLPPFSVLVEGASLRRCRKLLDAEPSKLRRFGGVLLRKMWESHKAPRHVNDENPRAVHAEVRLPLPEHQVSLTEGWSGLLPCLSACGLALALTSLDAPPHD